MTDHALARPAVLTPLIDSARRHDARPVAERLADLQRWLRGDLAALADDLGRLTHADADRAWRAAAHLIARPGKRLRPIAVILAARLGDRPPDARVIGAAVAAELAHAATLLHDDVIDLGAERRGAPAARMIYGNAASVLGGDHLLIEALRRLDGDPVLVAGLIDTLAAMVHGEALQLERRRRFDPDRALYLRIVQGKTAALFCWALRAGGHLGALAPDQIDALGRAGRALGMTFQLIDDLLDIAGDPALTGKDPGADLREGKLTWPLIVASERDPHVALQLRAAAAAEVDPAATPDPDRAAALITAIRATGALDATRAEARRHADAAHDALATLPDSRARRALGTLVDAALDRQT